MNNNGYSVPLEKLARADRKYIYKQHIMEHLVNTGQAEDLLGNTYKKLFKNGGICDFDIEYVSVYEAVKIITDCGGLAVLAHPGQQQNFNLIEKLVPFGLFGVECNHPSNNEEDRKIISEIASKFGLCLTGGSDYHGKYEMDGELGSELCESEAFINALRNRTNNRG